MGPSKRDKLYHTRHSQCHSAHRSLQEAIFRGLDFQVGVRDPGRYFNEWPTHRNRVGPDVGWAVRVPPELSVYECIIAKVL
jgi:hypothetical protein